jgi:protein-L-isoaspartate(D-aspartate) O-methyltransferase
MVLEMVVSHMILIIVLLLGIDPDDPYELQRLEMVKTQIEQRGISNPAVLRAMKKVPRHFFVPESQMRYAYEDRPLPIGHGQTISQPLIVAYMTEIINPKKDDTVLEIGTGSGYQAAVLAEVVKDVYTLEIISELAHEAAIRLKAMHYDNIHAKRSDGYHGWSQYAPFDAIVVTAAAPEIPPPLIDQLAEGGRMVIPVGSKFSIQNLVLVTKSNGKISKTNLMPVRFVPFTRD